MNFPQNSNPNCNSSQNQSSAIQAILLKSERFLKKSPGPKFLRIFENSNKDNYYVNHEYADASRSMQDNPHSELNNTKVSSINNTQRSAQHSKNVKTVGQLQSSFEKQLEKIKSIKFSKFTKSSSKKASQNRSTSVKNSKKQENYNLRTYLNSYDLEKTKKSKTEQLDFETIPRVAAFNAREGLIDKTQTFSFKCSPRNTSLNHEIRRFDSPIKRAIPPFPVCNHHQGKKAKYTVFLSEPPLLCSKCAVFYANEGYKLKLLKSMEPLQEIVENSANEELNEFPALKSDYDQSIDYLREKIEETDNFYSKQLSKIENSFEPIYRILEKQKEEAKKSISIYKEKTLEKINSLADDMGQEYESLLNPQNKSPNLGRLKAAINNFKNEEILFYKVSPDSSRLEKLISQLKPFYFFYPKYKNGQPIHSKVDHNESGNSFMNGNEQGKGAKFHSMMVRNGDSTMLEKSFQVKSNPLNPSKYMQYNSLILNHDHDNESLRNNNMNQNMNLKTFTKLDSENLKRDKDRGYIIFEDKESSEFNKPSEKRSSLSSPNFANT